MGRYGSDSIGALILCMSLILLLGPAGWPWPILPTAMAEVNKDKKKPANPFDLGLPWHITTSASFYWS